VPKREALGKMLQVFKGRMFFLSPKASKQQTETPVNFSFTANPLMMSKNMTGALRRMSILKLLQFRDYNFSCFKYEHDQCLALNDFLDHTGFQR